ncbi:polysaccharide deacetylase family protein [Streptomyces sp. NBC_01551]|uniref:polysaccharide deacetylase family protein n=1 Tax=Streptomyces sp. NBC_01551 TaxID=2975876 RepID=UPI0022524888|nr:polysaccharide deacetylase family protein [Streptomyces sp. NBC_01551]MCX4527109.1 polysaccharide deacetylase family protein [Streptomyces sp. NBC_01551]
MHSNPLTRRAALLGLTALLASTAAPSAAAAAGELDGEEVRRIPTDRRVAALTFNAAWNEDGLADVLATLRGRRAPATFFVTGEFAEAHPQALRDITAAGHGIGNHSHTHPHFRDITLREAEQEMDRADRAIRTGSGAAPAPFFRFPYSEVTEQGIAAANARGWTNVEFTLDTKGYLGTEGGMTVKEAVSRVADTLTPGQIVQMHVGTQNTGADVIDALALPDIIALLHSEGYEITDLRTALPGPGR